MSDTEREAGAPTYVERDILIANIKLDELNFRTDEVDSQRAAIRAMIQEQGFGLVRLAEHYLRHGLMPGERLLVIADDEEGEEEAFVVMEGNRRTTMMKLLQQPSLAAETVIYGPIAELARQFAERPQRTLPCVILPGRESALVWVEVKHSTGMGGAGVEKWGAPATARFGEYVRGKVTRWRAALRYLRDQGIDVTAIDDGIRSKTTAVSRVLNAGAMREELGVRFSQDGAIEFENGDIDAGTRLLRTMMEEMSDPSFSTNAVHSFDDRVDYIKGFVSLSVKARPDVGESDGSGDVDTGTEDGYEEQSVADPQDDHEQQEPALDGRANDSGSSDEIEDDASPAETATGGADDDHQVNGDDGRGPSTESGSAGEDPANGGRREGGRGVRRPPHQRNTLASTRRADSLNIADPRLNQLYHDARTLQVERHTAIAAVLIRVFLELSCEHYLASERVPVPTTIVRRNGGRPTTWHTYGVKFREKIEAALDHADPGRSMPGFAEIRRGLGSQDHLHSPENLHDYVHGLRTIPSARDLIIIWDRYHPLFARMYA